MRAHIRCCLGNHQLKQVLEPLLLVLIVQELLLMLLLMLLELEPMLVVQVQPRVHRRSPVRPVGGR